MDLIHFEAEFHSGVKATIPTIVNLISDPVKAVRKCALDAINIFTEHGGYIQKSKYEIDTL